MTIFELVAIYANAVGKHGPDSDEAKAVRARHAGDAEFIRYADGLDRVKRALGGSGMEETSPSNAPALAAFVGWMESLTIRGRRSVLGVIRDTFCRECGRKLPHTELGRRRCEDGE